MEIQTSFRKVKCTKNLITSINRFTLKEKYHILRILKNHNIDFSKNSYGYFFNLNNINDEIFNKLWKCVDLIECNRDIIKHMDKKREELINYYTSLIENNLIKTRKEKLDLYIQSLNVFDIDSPIKYKIQKRNIKKECDVDPDILIKEYLKKNKYPKNSVYHRILNKIKNSKSLKFLEKDNEESNEVDDLSSDYEFDGENENYENEDNGIDVVPAELEDNENTNDLNNEVNEKTNDIDIYENESDYSDDEESENIELQEEEILYQHNLNFYKKLLNKQGFVFNENLKCILQFQPYIV